MTMEGQSETTYNPSSAFVTAQWTAALRAVKGDEFGKIWGGGQGMELARRYEEALPTQTMEAQANGIANRTKYFNDCIKRHRECNQIVILGAGLDARAWQLEEHWKSFPERISLFEVDVPEAFDYKNSFDAEVKKIHPNEPFCRRITVGVDLSRESWTKDLVSAGFDKEKPSFFLIEGLTMYLPDKEAMDRLLHLTFNLMNPGSVVCGDVFVNVLTLVPKEATDVLASYGTRWSFEFASVADLETSFSSFVFVERPRNSTEPTVVRTASIWGVLGQVLVSMRKSAIYILSFVWNPVDNELAQKATTSITKAFDAVTAWPPSIRAWAEGMIAKGESSKFMDMVIADSTNHHGLAYASPATKQLVRNNLIDLTQRLPSIFEKAKATDDKVQSQSNESGMYYFYAKKS